MAKLFLFPVVGFVFGVFFSANTFAAYLITESLHSRQMRLCNVYVTTLTVTDGHGVETESVEFFRYIPKKQKDKNGAVVIHPPTGGPTALDKGYAKAFCRRGVQAVVLKSWSGYVEPGVLDFGTHDRASLHAIAATQMVIDFLNTPVVLLGESVGAIYSLMVMARDSRVKGAALIVGGGPLADVLMTTDQKIPREQREKRMVHFKLNSMGEYENLLRSHVKINPTDGATEEKRDQIWMMLSTADTTVPTSTQFELWERWGKPRYHTLPYSHSTTILSTYVFYRREIVNFLISKL